jgi:hypothetical protein
MSISNIKSEIETKRAELEQLEKKLAQAEQEVPEHRLARELHGLLCHWNHIDGCGWHYEVSGGVDNWSGQAHAAWLQRAQLIQRGCQDKGISTDDAIALYRLMRNPV